MISLIGHDRFISVKLVILSLFFFPLWVLSRFWGCNNTNAIWHWQHVVFDSLMAHSLHPLTHITINPQTNSIQNINQYIALALVDICKEMATFCFECGACVNFLCTRCEKLDSFWSQRVSCLNHSEYQTDCIMLIYFYCL